ncbi:VCBS repeat-containing protein [Fodinibius sediminis]|uniref:Repeat domain-containing protein n=1 Tax=Fodinibius sediminis TaxID=1214077 RepID=A0A521DP70_9BACT|nr:VCBS repeat-containing protein [Fodinibius sediminis]SMO73402.1 hypothetical protein SAMN06265218_11173 [Fodinibius sediminis]
MSCNSDQNSEPPHPPVVVDEHIVQGYLGEQHLANLVHRRGSDGDTFVGWGRTPITEWPVGSSSARRVVPENEDHRYSNGGTAVDLDDDGIDEIVTARGEMNNLRNASLMWFREVEGQKYWEGHTIADLWSSGYSAPHDIMPYARNDFKAVIANKSRNELHLFVVPEDLENDWTHYKIGTFPSGNQSGMVIRDINVDGHDDIVSGNFWVEAPSDPTQTPWTFHRFSEWDERGDNRWGGMNKHGVADFDDDGSVEIVTSEAEIPDARLSIFDRQSKDGAGLWKEAALDNGLEAPHSLVVADLNDDDQPDFIVGEMTAGGWDFPYNPNPWLYAYLNEGGLQFEKKVIYEGWGVHEMRLFPKPYEGKIMLYGADEIQPQKFNNMKTHVSYWLLSQK